jgi:hypothetical protein
MIPTGLGTPVRGPLTLHDATANSYKPPAHVGDYAGIFGAHWKITMPQYQHKSAPAIAHRDRRFVSPARSEAHVTRGRIQGA